MTITCTGGGCPFCAGEACRACGDRARRPCTHSRVERHQGMQALVEPTVVVDPNIAITRTGTPTEPLATPLAREEHVIIDCDGAEADDTVTMRLLDIARRRKRVKRIILVIE